MKNKLPYLKQGLMLMALIALIQCAPKKKLAPLKELQAIDKVKIGMNLTAAIEQLKKDYRVETVEISEFDGNKKLYEYFIYESAAKTNALFSFNGGYEEHNRNKIFRLSIKSGQYKTAEGAYVGMTVKELKEKARLKSASFDFNSGLFLHSGSFDGGYLLDLSTLKDKNYHYEEPKIETLPGELKVKEIIIF